MTCPTPLTPPITAAILTVSDRCAAGTAEDTAGPALRRILRDQLTADVQLEACVPDEQRPIRERLLDWARTEPAPDLILTTGGTGLAPRDITPEVTAAILERHHPALLELARLRCYDKTPLACLSRGIAGTIASTLIINLPGSKRGATEMLEALADVLPHAVRMLRGEDHPCRDHVQRPMLADVEPRFEEADEAAAERSP